MYVAGPVPAGFAYAFLWRGVPVAQCSRRGCTGLLLPGRAVRISPTNSIVRQLQGTRSALRIVLKTYPGMPPLFDAVFDRRSAYANDAQCFPGDLDALAFSKTELDGTRRCGVR